MIETIIRCSEKHIPNDAKSGHLEKCKCRHSVQGYGEDGKDESKVEEVERSDPWVKQIMSGAEMVLNASCEKTCFREDTDLERPQMPSSRGMAFNMIAIRAEVFGLAPSLAYRVVE